MLLFMLAYLQLIDTIEFCMGSGLSHDTVDLVFQRWISELEILRNIVNIDNQSKH